MYVVCHTLLCIRFFQFQEHTQKYLEKGIQVYVSEESLKDHNGKVGFGSNFEILPAKTKLAKNT